MKLEENREIGRAEEHGQSGKGQLRGSGVSGGPIRNHSR